MPPHTTLPYPPLSSKACDRRLHGFIRSLSAEHTHRSSQWNHNAPRRHAEPNRPIPALPLACEAGGGAGGGTSSAAQATAEADRPQITVGGGAGEVDRVAGSDTTQRAAVSDSQRPFVSSCRHAELAALREGLRGYRGGSVVSEGWNRMIRGAG